MTIYKPFEKTLKTSNAIIFIRLIFNNNYNQYHYNMCLVNCSCKLAEQLYDDDDDDDDDDDELFLWYG